MPIAIRGIYILQIYCEILSLYKKIENTNKRKLANDRILRGFYGALCRVPFSEEPYRSFLRSRRSFLLSIDSSIHCYLASVLFAINIKLTANVCKILLEIRRAVRAIGLSMKGQ